MLTLDRDNATDPLSHAPLLNVGPFTQPYMPYVRYKLPNMVACMSLSDEVYVERCLLMTR